MVPSTPQSVADGVLRLMNDPSLRERLGDAARNAAAAYDLPGVIERMKGIYLSVAPEGEDAPSGKDRDELRSHRA